MAELLLDAVQRGDLEGLRFALSKGSDPNSSHNNGLSALTLACKAGNTAIATALLESKADADFQAARTGDTPLLWAANHAQPAKKNCESFVALAERLLQYGARANVADSLGWTPLLVAACKGNHQLARLLLSVGARTDVANRAGDTPLKWSCQRGDLDLVEMLIPRLPLGYLRASPSSAELIEVANRAGSPAIVALLLRCGCPWNYGQGKARLDMAFARACRRVPPDTLVIEAFLARGFDVNYADEQEGNTLLHEALLLASSSPALLSLAEVLISYGASIAVRNRRGQTPLDGLTFSQRHHKKALKAAWETAERRRNVWRAAETDTVSTVTKALKEDEKAVSYREAVSGNTLLHSAASGGATLVTALLIQAKADVNATNALGQTPLQLAVFRETSQPSSVAAAAGAGAGAEGRGMGLGMGHAEGKRRQAPQLGGNSRVIKALLEAGASVEIFDKSNDSAFSLLSDAVCQHPVTELQRVAGLDPASDREAARRPSRAPSSFSSSVSSYGAGGLPSSEPPSSASSGNGDERLHVTPGEILLSRQLGQLLSSGLLADVAFRTEDGQLIRAHRAILAARSPVFAAMFSGRFAEGQQQPQLQLPSQGGDRKSPPVSASGFAADMKTSSPSLASAAASSVRGLDEDDEDVENPGGQEGDLDRSSGSSGGGLPVVPVGGISGKAMRALLEFAYTGGVSLTPYGVTLELLRAADVYGLSQLKVICEYRLVGKVDAMNVAELLLATDFTRLSILRTACYEFILRRFRVLSSIPGSDTLPLIQVFVHGYETYGKVSLGLDAAALERKRGTSSRKQEQLQRPASPPSSSDLLTPNEVTLSPSPSSAASAASTPACSPVQPSISLLASAAARSDA